MLKTWEKSQKGQGVRNCENDNIDYTFGEECRSYCVFNEYNDIK